MGFTTMGEESPIDESGTLWSKGHEIVCDETGTVIDGNHHSPKENDNDDEVERRCGERVYRYQNSERVKLVGGYTGSYDWGYEDDRGFEY
jgi:hypothetical protein